MFNSLIKEINALVDWDYVRECLLDSYGSTPKQQKEIDEFIREKRGI